MSEAQISALLEAAKPLAQRLIQTKGLYSLSQTDLQLLSTLKEWVETEGGEEGRVLKATGLTLYELALLLGTLSLHRKARRPNPAHQLVSWDETSFSSP